MWASFGGTSASTSAVAPAAAADVVATMRGTVARANAKTAPEDHRKVANSDIAFAPDDDKDWRWFDGDLNEYYNKLELKKILLKHWLPEFDNYTKKPTICYQKEKDLGSKLNKF